MTPGLFDLDTPPTAAPVHAHTGYGCRFCATRTGPEAATAATAAVVRDQAWWNAAERWLTYQTPGWRFTADDLVTDIGRPTGSPNAIGALLRTWSQRGVITGAGYAQAERPESHARILRLWRVA